MARDVSRAGCDKIHSCNICLQAHDLHGIGEGMAASRDLKDVGFAGR